MVPAAVFVLGVVVATNKLWRGLANAARRRFGLAASIYLAGAVGMEIVDKIARPGTGLTRHVLLHTEEALEKCGAAPLVGALLHAFVPTGHVLVKIASATPGENA